MTSSARARSDSGTAMPRLFAAYVAALDVGDVAEFVGAPAGNLDAPGLLILDTSEIQARKPNPQVRLMSALT